MIIYDGCTGILPIQVCIEMDCNKHFLNGLQLTKFVSTECIE